MAAVSSVTLFSVKFMMCHVTWMTCHVFRRRGGVGGARARGVHSGAAGQVCEHGRGPGGHGVMDGPDADRGRLVPAGGEQPGEAAALLRPAVPAGGGGRDLLRAARRADA